MKARILAPCGLLALVAADCKKQEPEAPRIEYVEPAPSAVLPNDSAAEDLKEQASHLSRPDAASASTLITVKEGRERLGNVIFSFGPEAVIITCIAVPGWMLKEVSTCVRLPQAEGRVITGNDCIFSETRFMAPGSKDTTVIVGMDVFGQDIFGTPVRRTAVVQVEIAVESLPPRARLRHGTAFYEFEVP